MLIGDTIAFKLSYKINWKKQTKGKTTYFGKFMDGNILK